MYKRGQTKATYHVNRIALVNTEKLDEYIELMCADEADYMYTELD